MGGIVRKPKSHKTQNSNADSKKDSNQNPRDRSRSNIYLLSKNIERKDKEPRFREIRAGIDISQMQKDDVLYFLKYTKQDVKKDVETFESIQKTLCLETKDLLGEDLNWILEFMLVADIPRDTVIYRPGESCPYFFICLSGEFSLDGRTCMEANLSSLFTADKTTNELKCNKAGHLYYISRLSFQKLKVEQLKSRITQGENLLNNITEIPGLRELPGTQIEQLATCLKPAKFSVGEIIMKQGAEGSTMFFIQQGSIAITQSSIEKISITNNSNYYKDSKNKLGFVSLEMINSKNSKVEIIARRGPGEYIGEGALLESLSSKQNTGRRNATAFALEIVHCLSLQRSDFETHMGSLKELFEHNFIVKILRSIPLLKPIPESQLFTMSTKLHQRIYESGSYVVHQGDTGDQFFIIKEGTLECTLDTQNEKSVSVGSLIAGDYFGEGALLTQAPRRCSVVVVGNKDATLLVLSKQNFQNCIPNQIQSSLGENFSKRAEVNTDNKTTKMSFDDLDIVKTLGSGSYGTVDLVRNRITGQTYALKQIRKATVVAKKQQKFVQNERRLLSMLSSKFVINLIQTFKTNDSVYILSEVCLGGELYNFMKKCVEMRMKQAEIQDNNASSDFDDVYGCFDIHTQARFFLACIILSIEYIHSKGVVHRDIKPENIMLTSTGYTKLVDFGFAKCINSQRTYSLCGTPEYTAPEVFKRVGHSKQVDYWAAGIILYEMASGFSPFHIESQNSWDCYQEIAKYEKYYPRIQFPSSFSNPIQEILLNLMQPNPLKRYGSLKLPLVDLKQHIFFKEGKNSSFLDWSAIENQTYTLPAEFCPPTPEYSLDVKNFAECLDRHSKDHEKVPDELIKNDNSGWDAEF